MTTVLLAEMVERGAAARHAEVICRALLATEKSCEFAIALARLAWVREQIAATPSEPGGGKLNIYTPEMYQWRTQHEVRLNGLLREAGGLEANIEYHYVPCGTCVGCETRFGCADEPETPPYPGRRIYGRPSKRSVVPVPGGPEAVRTAEETSRFNHYYDDE